MTPRKDSCPPRIKNKNDYYRPHPKDGEGNVFTLSTPGGGVSPARGESGQSSLGGVRGVRSVQLEGSVHPGSVRSVQGSQDSPAGGGEGQVSPAGGGQSSRGGSGQSSRGGGQPR